MSIISKEMLQSIPDDVFWKLMRMKHYDFELVRKIGEMCETHQKALAEEPDLLEEWL